MRSLLKISALVLASLHIENSAQAALRQGTPLDISVKYSGTVSSASISGFTGAGFVCLPLQQIPSDFFLQIGNTVSLSFGATPNSPFRTAPFGCGGMFFSNDPILQFCTANPAESLFSVSSLFAGQTFSTDVTTGFTNGQSGRIYRGPLLTASDILFLE